MDESQKSRGPTNTVAIIAKSGPVGAVLSLVPFHSKVKYKRICFEKTETPPWISAQEAYLRKELQTMIND